jgi:hypothetical protein
LKLDSELLPEDLYGSERVPIPYRYYQYYQDAKRDRPLLPRPAGAARAATPLRLRHCAYAILFLRLRQLASYRYISHFPKSKTWLIEAVAGHWAAWAGGAPGS